MTRDETMQGSCWMGGPRRLAPVEVRKCLESAETAGHLRLTILAS